MKSVLRDKFKTVCLHQKIGELSSNNLMIHLNVLEIQLIKAKPSRRKEIMNIRIEMNEIQTKEHSTESTKQRVGSGKRYTRLVNHLKMHKFLDKRTTKTEPREY